MIPQIENSIINETIDIISYPNKTYRCSETHIVGKVDDLEAVKQSIGHILSIERYAYIIYDDNYGVELEKYIGQSYEFLESTIEDTLREALLQDDRIVDVKVTKIYKSTEKHPMIDKTKLYNIIQTEDERDIVTEVNLDNIVTNNNIDLISTSNTSVEVINVEFDVYCKQGVINTEVKVSV